MGSERPESNINLLNVPERVIQRFQDAGYPLLEFNRGRRVSWRRGGRAESEALDALVPSQERQQRLYAGEAGTVVRHR